MDPIKEAFIKIKEEILLLKNEIKYINERINDIQTIPTHNQSKTHQHTNTPTHLKSIPTHNQPIQPLYNNNTPISMGNEGVPTHTPTHTPTHQQLEKDVNLDFKKANSIIESLDIIKKEIRLKFKRLTPQEMLVFSTIYTLENENYKEITYKVVAIQLKLSESSIRDYINKLIIKGVPIKKTRRNNKTIILNISKDLKNIATLATIQSLRTI